MHAGNLNRRARVATVEGVLIEEKSAVVLGDHVKFLRQGTIGDEAGTPPYRSEPHAGPEFHVRIWSQSE